MRNIYIIGTLHGFTPIEDLSDILEKLNFTQILIELPEDAPEKFKENNDIRDEMMWTYQWAKKKGVKVGLFDEYQPLFKKGMSVESPEYKEYVEKEREFLKKYTWQDFNKVEFLEKLNLHTEEIEEKLFDRMKSRKREKKMLENIKRLMSAEGNVVIITGVSHLDFFKKNLENATIPLR